MDSAVQILDEGVYIALPNAQPSMSKDWIL